VYIFIRHFNQSYDSIANMTPVQREFLIAGWNDEQRKKQKQAAKGRARRR